MFQSFQIEEVFLNFNDKTFQTFLTLFQFDA